MKKRFFTTLATGLFLVGMTGIAQAIPSLQLGAYADPLLNQGIYVNYTNMIPDEDTAFISGGALLAAGVYGPNTVLVGGQYQTGNDWSDFLGNSSFDGKGAIIVATVFEGFDLGSSILIDGKLPFLYLQSFNFPNNHYPVNEINVDYYFFDIGDFANNNSTVPDFASESGAANGEIKNLPLAISGFDWVHFDLMALVTDEKGGENNTKVTTTWDINPGSHDVTYNDPGTPVPEPATMLLFGTGLVGLAGLSRRRKA